MNKEKIQALETELQEKDRQIGVLQKEQIDIFKERNTHWQKIVKSQRAIIQAIKEEMMDMAKKFRELELELLEINKQKKLTNHE